MKVFPILILSIILLSPLGIVLATGEPCCLDGHCSKSGERCIPCEDDLTGCEGELDSDSDWVVTAGKGGVCGPLGSVVICSPTKYREIGDIIEGITNWISWIIIAISPLMIGIGAFVFITAVGDPNKVAKAKKIILWSIVGLAIAVFGKGLISFIIYILGA